LDGYYNTNYDGFVVVAVNSVDGLWTNVYDFINFFSHYVGKTRLGYLVHEGGSKFRVLSIKPLFRVIHEVLTRRVNSATDAHDMVEEWITLAIGKLLQREGRESVKALLMLRRNTQVIDIDVVQPRPHLDPSVRVVRIVRTGGTDFRPLFKQEEESRHSLQDMGGRIKCPEKHC
jgi:hypothetical protein